MHVTSPPTACPTVSLSVLYRCIVVDASPPTSLQTIDTISPMHVRMRYCTSQAAACTQTLLTHDGGVCRGRPWDLDVDVHHKEARAVVAEVQVAALLLLAALGAHRPEQRARRGDILPLEREAREPT